MSISRRKLTLSFASTLAITCAINMAAAMTAQADCPQQRTPAEEKSCQEAHNPCAPVVEQPGCGSVPVNGGGQVVVDGSIDDKDREKFERKRSEIESKRQRKLAEEDADFQKDLQKKYKDTYGDFYNESRKLNAKQQKLLEECQKVTSPCHEDLKRARKVSKELDKLARKIEEQNTEEFRNAKKEYENYVAKRVAERERKKAKINADADKDIDEEFAKMGKPGFWGRVGGFFKGAGKAVFVKTPRFIYQRGKDVVWDGPKHVIKSIGGVLFRCKCEDGVTLTDCRKAPTQRAMEEGDTVVSTPSVGQKPSAPSCGSSSPTHPCKEFDISSIPSVPMTAVADIPLQETVSATTETAAPASSNFINNEVMSRSILKAWSSSAQ